MPHACHGEPLSTWNRGLQVGVEVLSQLLLGEARTTNACMWRSDLDLLGAAAGRRWHCDARGRRIHTCTAQAELGKHCEQAAIMNCMVARSPHAARCRRQFVASMPRPTANASADSGDYNLSTTAATAPWCSTRSGSCQKCRGKSTGTLRCRAKNTEKTRSIERVSMG